jgi:ketosteroid isomerase-like protein
MTTFRAWVWDAKRVSFYGSAFESEREKQMNKSVLSAVVALLILGAIPALPAPKPAGGDAEFKELIREYYEAWSTANPDKPAPMYAKDADLVFYDVAPLKYTGWDEYKVGVQKNLFDAMASGSLTPKDDLKITRRGNIAWTSVTAHFSAKMKDGKAMEADIRHTAIWEKRGGKWLIVHEHVSAPLQ